MGLQFLDDHSLKAYLEQNSPVKISFVGHFSSDDFAKELREREIVRAAREAHKTFWQPTSDESTGDRQANCVIKAWKELLEQNPFCSDLIFEFCIGSENSTLKERVDLFDTKYQVAYEIKASGKNASHEFYKDLFKALVSAKTSSRTIKKLVFLTERRGITGLSKGLPSRAIELCQQMNVQVRLLALDDETWSVPSENQPDFELTSSKL